ncbi:hypothetical protein BJ138DRAFT_750069 [Hygrophoropsis aurantiaca]|uniref:Uncharacterized protein n=1 Tax=Hygrophoropsis aurantiaca TaxID=72124 RepID=A0ACB8AHH5_9AGAM|nr:hypothetical protein BJ138DRAFT_750069 [Hygrophoropsis aurantiaca]
MLKGQTNYDVFTYRARRLLQDVKDKAPSVPATPGIPVGADAPMPYSLRAAITTRAATKTTPALPVGILGAGAGGLYTALILEDLGIPYRIIEARPNVGGRLMTYKFPDPLGAPYNYFDIGAMRFPEIDAMQRLFHLFKYPPLNTDGRALKAKLKPFYFKGAGNNNTFLSYNGVTVMQNAIPKTDPFMADQIIQSTGASAYIAAGVKAIMDDVLEPFATGILEDIEAMKNNEDMEKRGYTGWDKLMEFDQYSTRAYMALKYIPSDKLGIPKKNLPVDVINWCETFDKSTGWYDRSLAETVLEAVAFGWQPGPDPPPTTWHCIDGGSQEIANCMADYILSKNKDAIVFKSRVSAIALRDDGEGMDVVTGTGTHRFSHVISTIPLPVLRTVDLSKAKVLPRQANALRDLNYGPSIKIGMQFKSAWWTTGTDKKGRPLNIIGGQTYTDRPLRTIVYPSFGNVLAGETTTLIASYCWTEDAMRMGALIDNDDELLTTLVLKDLADIHNVDVDFLRGELLGVKGWNWFHDPLAMGAFAFFGPGKFVDSFRNLNTPAGDGFLHFAGEAISVRHAWVEGALDSAWRAVCEMLLTASYAKYRAKFYENWGLNSEWIQTFDDKKDKEERQLSPVNLLYKHIAIVQPDLDTHVDVVW